MKRESGQTELSLGNLLDLVYLTSQSRDLAQSWVLRILLAKHHVRALHALLQNVHDLRCYLANLGIVEIDGGDYGCQPVQALIDVLVE